MSGAQEKPINGKADAHAFRWLLPNEYPGAYVVTVFCVGFITRNYRAVVDDFGTLVQAESKQ